MFCIKGMKERFFGHLIDHLCLLGKCCGLNACIASEFICLTLNVVVFEGGFGEGD